MQTNKPIGPNEPANAQTIPRVLLAVQTIRRTLSMRNRKPTLLHNRVGENAASVGRSSGFECFRFVNLALPPVQHAYSSLSRQQRHCFYY